MRRVSPDIPKGNIKNLKGILRYLTPHKLCLFGVLIALIISSGAVLGIGTGIRHLVDSGFSSNSTAFLDRALFFLLCIITALSLATYARFYLITKVGEKVVADIRRDIYARIIKLSPAFFETTKTGEIMSRITTDTTVLQVIIGSSLSIALRNILLFSGGLVMLVVTSPKLAMYIAVMIPVVVLPVLILGKRVRNLSVKAQKKVAELSGHVEETLLFVKTVQAYAKEEAEYNSFSAKVEDSLIAAMGRVKVRAALTAIVIFVVFGSVGLILWVGGHDVIAGNITAGELSSFVFYSIISASAFGAISEVIGDIQRAAGATEGLLELLNAEPDIKDPDNPVHLPAQSDSNIIAFDNITFNYPSRPDIKALTELSFDIKNGETVALVGPSGSGKSTVLQLLMRFYDPLKGNVLLDGIDIRQLRVNELREQFAYVSQDTVIFSSSVKENVKYGNPNASDKNVIDALKQARAYDFIMKMPEGLDTFLGEKGVRLSGGEKQRISIARAILKDPRILLLDEATSALDAENEKMVQEALEDITVNRTTIVIAHRFSTVLKADRIMVVNNGKIEATGTHAELVKENKLYKRLAKMQLVT